MTSAAVQLPKPVMNNSSGPGADSAASLHVDGDGVAAGRGGDKEFVTGILDDGGRRGIHAFTNSTRYTVNLRWPKL